jgi:hypothetical protein
MFVLRLPGVALRDRRCVTLAQEWRRGRRFVRCHFDYLV